MIKSGCDRVSTSNAVCLFLAVPWVSFQCVTVAFPDMAL